MGNNCVGSDEYDTKDNFPEGVHDKTICGKCLMFAICNNLKDIYNNN
mgnify:CR=1 FL=1